MIKRENMLPKMLFGNELNSALSTYPPYNYSSDEDEATRLSNLNDLYKIFVSNNMAKEIYQKIYMMTEISLKRKCTINSIKLLNQCHQNIDIGIATGMTSATIIGPSGIGKTSCIQKIVNMLNKTIEIKEPYCKIIPIVTVTCPFDANYKGLLIQILCELDNQLGTTYYEKSKKSTMNAQQLLTLLCQVCNLHIGLLIIDEIQFLSEHKNAGPQLLRMILQLVNNSGINVLMVGTSECIPFFQKVPQIARRTVGLQYKTMKYDEDFIKLCNVLFSYQYVKLHSKLSGVILEWLFEHSGGIPASLVALIHDAQEIAILNNTETLNLQTLCTAYDKRLQMLHSYIQPSIKETKKVSRNNANLYLPIVNNLTIEYSIQQLIINAKKDNLDVIKTLKENLIVWEIKL